jgi:hypothetical protein
VKSRTKEGFVVATLIVLIFVIAVWWFIAYRTGPVDGAIPCDVSQWKQADQFDKDAWNAKVGRERFVDAAKKSLVGKNRVHVHELLGTPLSYSPNAKTRVDSYFLGNLHSYSCGGNVVSYMQVIFDDSVNPPVVEDVKVSWD